MTDANANFDQPNQNLTNLFEKDAGKTLQEKIANLTPYYEGRRKLNQFLGIGIGLLGIGLSLGATITGIVTDNAKIAAIFGACAATTQALLFAYPVDKRAAAYRVIAAKNNNLSIDLEIKKHTEEQLQSLLEEFKAIRLEAAIEETKIGNVEDTVDQLRKFLQEYDRHPSTSKDKE
jgi:hypothetical protein